MTEYILGHMSWHIVSGRINGEVHTFCGRGLSTQMHGPMIGDDEGTFSERRSDVCKSCRKGRDHALNARAADPETSRKYGGIPVTSGRLGSGRRAY